MRTNLDYFCEKSSHSSNECVFIIIIIKQKIQIKAENNFVNFIFFVNFRQEFQIDKFMQSIKKYNLLPEELSQE